MKPEIHTFEVDSPDEQKIVFRSQMEHSITGEIEDIEITVTGFKNPEAVPAAVMQFAQGIVPAMMQDFANRQSDKPHPMDNTIERILNLDD